MAAIIETPDSVTMFYLGQSYTVPSDWSNFTTFRDHVRAGEYDLAVENATPMAALLTWAGEGATLDETGSICIDGRKLPSTLNARILELQAAGAPVDYLLRFFERLQENPSRNSVEQLYKFLEHSNLPLTESGFFLGYKGVRDDFMDKYSGTIDNSVGQKPSVARNTVQDDPNVGCAPGLHVGTHAYAESWAGPRGRVMTVLVDPAKVVSVPHDCNHQKLRASEYEVIAESRGPIEAAAVCRSEEEDVYWQAYQDEEYGDDDYWQGDDFANEDFSHYYLPLEDMAEQTEGSLSNFISQYIDLIQGELENVETSRIALIHEEELVYKAIDHSDAWPFFAIVSKRRVLSAIRTMFSDLEVEWFGTYGA